MKTLPHELKILKLIGVALNDYLKSPDTAVEIRANELYEVICKNAELKSEFPTARKFNQFLREQHQKNQMEPFITYRVDTSNHEAYQWYFRRRSN